MRTTTAIASTPTKLKRTFSIMLSPSKDVTQQVRTLEKTNPTHQEIFSWTLTPDATASCHVRDVLSLQERREGAAEPVQANKHTGSDFFWLGRVPCRNVRVVGLVVEATQYEYRTLYTVDDGTGVLECVQRNPAVKRVPEPGKPPPFISEYPPPTATVGDCVCVVGRAQKKGEGWQLAVDSMERCLSRNDELKHYLAVRKLHETNYTLSDPYPVPIPEKAVQAGPSTPTRKHKIAEPSSRVSDCTAQSSPQTAIASSPVKGEHVPAIPTKLRHPSRLSHAELTQNTFRIYLKYFMDNGPTHHDIDRTDDPFSISFAQEPSTPTRLSKHSTHPTPRPSGFNTSTMRPQIDRLDFSKLPSSHAKKENTMRGYSISYLRRVPELTLLANRVAKQEIRAARRLAKEKASRSSSSKPSATSSNKARQSSTPTTKEVKRLFVRALNELYREGSIVIWDCPSYSCADLSAGDTSFLWKTSSSMVAPSANTAANATSDSTVTGTLALTYEAEEGSGDISEPDPNEDVYVPITPDFLASCLEEIIPVVQKAERARQPKGVQAYWGASTEGLLRFLKKDDRWIYVHVDSVEAALKHLDDDGRAWMSGPGQWQLTV